MPKNDYWRPEVLSKLTGQRIDTIILDEVGISKDKFAPVVPYHFYQQFLVYEYVPKSVLLLAHDVVSHPDEYKELFKDPRWDDTTIFMDNSLVELKKAVDIEMVRGAVDIIERPQVVVICPDVMAEGEASARATIDSWGEWAWRFKDHEKLVVIQGNSMQSFLGCLEAIDAAQINPEWVSIPRVTEGLWGYHRRELIPFVRAIFPDAKLHLLGFSNYIWEDLRAAAHPDVESIDSAVPFRMNTLNILSEEVPPRGDWWTEAKFTLDCLERVEAINDFINNFPQVK